MEEPQIKRTCIKLAMLGDSNVGKTLICHSYLNIESSNDYLLTIGKEKYECLMKMKNGEENKIIIYDIASQERNRSICFKTLKYVNFPILLENIKKLKYVQGIVVVFDLGDRKSFENVNAWLEEIKDHYGKILIVLFGNKCDIDESQRVVTTEEIQKLVKENNLTYYETSAKIQKGYSEGFEKLINDVYDRYIGNTGIKFEDKKKVDKTDKNRCCDGKEKNQEN